MIIDYIKIYKFDINQKIKFKEKKNITNNIGERNIINKNISNTKESKEENNINKNINNNNENKDENIINVKNNSKNYNINIIIMIINKYCKISIT